MARSEAPASRKLPATATPTVLPPPRQSPTLPACFGPRVMKHETRITAFKEGYVYFMLRIFYNLGPVGPVRSLSPLWIVVRRVRE